MAKVTKLVAKAGGRSPVPVAPEWLSDEARAEWDRVAPVLHRRGALTDATRGILESYCSAVGTGRQCEIALAREGVTITSPSGSKPHPCLGAKNRAAAVALQMAKRLGLFSDAEQAKTGGGHGENDPYADLGIR